MATKSEAVERAEAYYDSTEADAFYQTIWGGQDIHIGLYQDEVEPIADASRRTVETMATRLVNADETTRILDLGAGYGGAARYLADRFGCQVTCLNLSETQNALNRELTEAAGLTDRVSVVYGDFESIPDPDDRYHIVWSQDAILHSGNRARVLDEIRRVLIGGGQFIFTDPMQSDDCPDGVLQPILDRIQLTSLASFSFYRAELGARGFDESVTPALTDQLRMHYSRVGLALKDRYDEAVKLSGQTYVDNMIKGLQNWVDGADRGYLAWGIMDFRLTA
ncbi:MAG: methyltransferase domain-containing protein [Alphaproteobacteria bacterium]|jgi:SAM-dependent methyltransferase|nr:methyltransferase domain-containing protein [Alphaproteobacteria bacterium]